MRERRGWERAEVDGGEPAVVDRPCHRGGERATAERRHVSERTWAQIIAKEEIVAASDPAFGTR